MTYDEAEKEIKEYIDPKTGDLHSVIPWVHWKRGQVISLDGDFTASELEAFAVYMKGTPRG